MLVRECKNSQSTKNATNAAPLHIIGHVDAVYDTPVNVLHVFECIAGSR
jgi:hypothetical protein